MDRHRRRYVPSSEGLEDRQLLSAAPPQVLTNPYSTTAVASGQQVDGSAPAPQTIAAKQRRIDNLPFFLGLQNRDGAIPQPTVANIQQDLRPLVGQLHQGSSTIAASFNLDLRRAQRYQNIRPQDAADLNRDFGAALIAAGAQPGVVADLQNQMTQLVDFESRNLQSALAGNSAIAASNDYATVLQLALEVGRPLVYPAAPSLIGADHQGNAGKIPVTKNARPTLTGTYIKGANIQIVDVNNKVVLGTAAIDAQSGQYQVKFNDKLPNGIYTVRVRAEDAGYLSDPSPKYTFKVAVPVPKVTVAAKTPAGPTVR